jgi:Rrf2 family cysteine metabolism transcriptional repressor
MQWRIKMRISSKGRYGLAAMISMAQKSQQDEQITIVSIADKLGISKIYLEQVFSLLKRAGLVTSIKGAQGGYKLARTADKITAGQIMAAIETGLFEKTERAVSDDCIYIDQAMESLVWDRLDNTISTVLESVTLSDLSADAEKNRGGKDFMFYI